MARQNQMLSETLFQARRLYAFGRLTAARGVLEGYYAKHQDHAGIVPLYLLKVYVRQGENKAAYQLVAPIVGQDPQVDILASIVASRAGEVYQGEREFLIEYLKSHDPYFEDIPGLVPQSKNPRALAVLGYLAAALATGSGEDWDFYYYTNEANKLDPGNPEGALLLSHCLYQQKRYSEEVALLRSALKRDLRPGQRHDDLIAALRLAIDMNNNVGDGKTFRRRDQKPMPRVR